jgi:DNA-binding CsgD family transcriptional regulator/tetratricopeptide (TPR) repeat protein
MAGVPLAGTKVLAAKTPGPDQTPIKLAEMLGFIGGRLDQRWVLLSGGLAGRVMSVALASPYVGIELMIRTGTRRDVYDGSLAMDRSLPLPGQHMSLRGRANECALLDEFAGAVRRGESRSLVLRGEAGIGKTALLQYLIESASDLTVVRAVGVESEIELAYASLQQLCGPMLERMERLPAPQREALEIVFGLSTGVPPDRFLVGLAVLSLLSDVAEERPLLCVVDDAQWIDHASALTLAFVARRLLAEPVGLVFAAREAGEELRDVTEMRVRGLREGDARALLNSALRIGLNERVRDQIIAETRGNPLALLELPRGLTASQLAGGFGLVGAQALPGRIEESFVRRLNVLSDSGRRLLLLAAAESTGDPLLLWRAAEPLGIGPEAADDLEQKGLLAIAHRVTFRHPLVRSAVYGSAAPSERRAVHLALGEATDGDADPDRRAWHLAAAASRPDEQVALELERSAGRAQARGGLDAAASFLRRAAVLTGDPGRRGGRALAAAEACLRAGAFDAARELLAAAEVNPLDELQRAQVDLLRAQVTLGSGVGNDAPQQLLEAARSIESLSAKLARETYLDAWGAALFAGGSAPSGTLQAISSAAMTAPRAADPPHASDLLLDGFALLMTEGRVAARATLARAVSTFASSAGASIEEGVRWSWLAVSAAATLWDYDTWRTIHARQVSIARDAGALEALPIQIHGQVICDVCGGEFAAARSMVAEANAVGGATGARIAPYGAVLLAALEGRENEYLQLSRPVVEEVRDIGQGVAVQWTSWGLAILYNGLGRYADALQPAQEASDETPELFISAWALAELVEAAFRSGNAHLAGEAVERLADTTRPSGTDWALGVEARSRALVSEGATAESLYRDAIERLSRTQLRPELARAHLLYGEWLRREGRRVDAREQLRTAYDQLTSIGMEAFAERARRELLATGETARKRVDEMRDELTVQEALVARLARDGLSNPEIGTRLFISPRTVKYHLHKVFIKLDITTRSQLAAVLPSDHTIGQPL